MKKLISTALAVSIATAVLASFPICAATAPLISSDFEGSLDGWTARGTATSVELSSASSASGSQCAAVSGRTASWNGIEHSLSSGFEAGAKYSITAKVMQQAAPTPVTFKLTVQYTGSSGTVYDTFATESVISGTWTPIGGVYEVPSGSGYTLYFETDDSNCDFFIDDVLVTSANQVGPPEVLKGDVDGNGTVDKNDAKALQKFLLAEDTTTELATGADMDSDGKINGKDLTLLKRRLLFPPVVTTTSTSATTVSTQTTGTTATTGGISGKTDPTEYMQKIGAQMTKDVPSNVKSRNTGTLKNVSYFSKKATHNKNGKVWLPAGYSESKKYNLMIMNHGIFGDESSMTSGFSVQEMASSLIDSGEAEPFIIFFTQMYTDPGTQGSPGFNITMDVMDKYDDFIFDVVESIIPYCEENYSIMTGRDHTAVAGFSMGGRESLYCGVIRPDVFGYVCASSPAPGIVPASDSFLSNHLGSYNWERTARLKDNDFKIDKDKLPYLIMIGGGTNDGVVGTFPKQYHELFDKNGTPNIWMEVSGGGHDGSVGTPLFYNFFRAVFKA